EQGLMKTTSPFRIGLHYATRVLFFVGFDSVFTSVDVTNTQEITPSMKWVVASFATIILGMVAQRLRTPAPLKTIKTTPPGWPWFFTIMIVFPWLVGWLPWHGHWLILLFSIAAAIGGWASYLPVHRRRVIRQQYGENSAVLEVP